MIRLIGILSILSILAAGSLYAQNPPSEQIRAEAEETARLLAKLLQAERLVIEQNQTIIDDAHTGDKGFTPEVFERQLYDAFHRRTGLDLSTSSGRTTAGAIRPGSRPVAGPDRGRQRRHPRCASRHQSTGDRLQEFHSRHVR